MPDLAEQAAHVTPSYPRKPVDRIDCTHAARRAGSRSFARAGHLAEDLLHDVVLSDPHQIRQTMRFTSDEKRHNGRWFAGGVSCSAARLASRARIACSLVRLSFAYSLLERLSGDCCTRFPVSPRSTYLLARIVLGRSLRCTALGDRSPGHMDSTLDRPSPRILQVFD